MTTFKTAFHWNSKFKVLVILSKEYNTDCFDGMVQDYPPGLSIHLYYYYY